MKPETHIEPFYLKIVGLKTKHLDHAASHFGKTIGITNFIRSLPHASKQRRVLVPQDLLLKYKLSQENFIRLDEPEKIQDVVYDLASQAVAHYEHVSSDWIGPPFFSNSDSGDVKSYLFVPGKNFERAHQS